MTPLVLFLIPSRQRPLQLVDAIRSIKSTADNPDAVDYIVRMDDDDEQSLHTVKMLIPDLKYEVGPRLHYHGIEPWLTERCQLSDAAWICPFNDDMMLEGNGWDSQLRDIPTRGFIVQPETVMLGPSKYTMEDGTCCPFVPNQCWTQFGWKAIKQPADTFLATVTKVKGWQTRFLKGLTVHHNRKVDATLPRERF